MTRRFAWTTLVGAVIVLTGLLLRTNSQAAVIDQEIGPTRCEYDTASKEVLVSVPLKVETRGEVTMEVRAEVHDRRDPGRMPYVSTEVATFDDSGAQDEQRVIHRIAMSEPEWRAGFNECAVSLRTVRQP